MKSAVACAALTMVAVLGSAGSCDVQSEPYRPVVVDVEDCDAEDVKKRDLDDCPHLRITQGPSARPVRTAYQPAPTRTKRR